jgi:hypothetical protein
MGSLARRAGRRLRRGGRGGCGFPRITMLKVCYKEVLPLKPMVKLSPGSRATAASARGPRQGRSSLAVPLPAKALGAGAAGRRLPVRPPPPA